MPDLPVYAAHDPLADLSAWMPVTSGQAQLELALDSAPQGATGAAGAALRIDFDFKGAGGFVVARCVLRRAMPQDYALRFRLRGRGPVNTLELKLVDATGNNVWRYVKKDLALSSRWRRFEVPSRDVEFAWGPAGGGVITELSALEFALVPGEGGAGTMWLDDLQIADGSAVTFTAARASSELPGFEADQSLTGAGWRPEASDAQPWLLLEAAQAPVIGGLVIDWPGGAPASGFRVRASHDGQRWKTLHKAPRAHGKRSYLYLPSTRARLLRLELNEPSAGAVVRVQAFEFSRSINAFWHNVAQAEPRGWYPRWLLREQSLWTPSGTANGTQCALINEEGMVEVAQGSFSIEPMLWVRGRLYTWADVVTRPALVDGWMPVPSVTWETAEWRLTTEARTSSSGTLRVGYRVENLGGEPLSARLFVVLRPFQVTPPWQQFNELGGVSRMHHLVWRDGAVEIDATLRIVPLSAAGEVRFGAIGSDEGSIAAHLATGDVPAAVALHDGHDVRDAMGFASGALAFDIALDPHQSSESAVACVPAAAPRMFAEPAFDWGAKLSTTSWAGNDWAQQAIDALRTATAQVLITRSGPALQPGPRRYTRSWIRDGTIMSAALLRMGCAQEVREFIRWYAPYQRADGFVPCLVDRDGPDWLVEHDSHGELIALIADYHAFSADDGFLAECWEFVCKAMDCIEGLLEWDRDGLLPISVSHEGYLSQAVHSYWDDFWALRGIGDAAHLARALGHRDHATRWQDLGARFGTALFASIEATRARFGIDYVAGSVEKGDFDPTSTASAICLLDVPPGLDRTLVLQTFDAYLAYWRKQRSGEVQSLNTTPYAIRIIGALVRLDRRDAALELLRYFLAQRRPPAWNQWPEIAWGNPDAPAHLGDLPHTWVAAEYVLAVRSLFAYEREADRVLVLSAGLAGEWLDGSGVSVRAIPTLYGRLSYTLRRLDAHSVCFEIGPGVAATMVLKPPLTGALRRVTVDGAAHAGFDRDSVTIMQGAARVVCSTGAAG